MHRRSRLNPRASTCSPPLRIIRGLIRNITIAFRRTFPALGVHFELAGGLRNVATLKSARPRRWPRPTAAPQGGVCSSYVSDERTMTARSAA
jgi:hypothetical protein